MDLDTGLVVQIQPAPVVVTVAMPSGEEYRFEGLKAFAMDRQPEGEVALCLTVLLPQMGMEELAAMLQAFMQGRNDLAKQQRPWARGIFEAPEQEPGNDRWEPPDMAQASQEDPED